MDGFAFRLGETPLSTWAVPAAVPALYLGSLAAGRRLVARRGRPFSLLGAVAVHNGALAAASAVLLALMAAELWRMLHAHGFSSVFCDEAGAHTAGRLVALVYVNYLFKYVELADTLLLVLRGKPTPFLHVYHHTATLLLCWSQLRAQSCMQWVPITLNLAVHTVMYSYYCLHALGHRPWWKRFLTLGQIVQFVAGLAAALGALGSRFAHDLVLWARPDAAWVPPRCWGSYEGAAIGVGVIASYLVLFIDLYRKAYRRKAAAAAAGPDSQKKQK